MHRHVCMENVVVPFDHFTTIGDARLRCTGLTKLVDPQCQRLTSVSSVNKSIN